MKFKGSFEGIAGGQGGVGEKGEGVVGQSVVK